MVTVRSICQIFLRLRITIAVVHILVVDKCDGILRVDTATELCYDSPSYLNEPPNSRTDVDERRQIALYAFVHRFGFKGFTK